MQMVVDVLRLVLYLLFEGDFYGCHQRHASACATHLQTQHKSTESEYFH